MQLCDSTCEIWNLIIMIMQLCDSTCEIWDQNQINCTGHMQLLLASTGPYIN